MPRTLVSYCDSCFASVYWKSLHEIMDTKLALLLSMHVHDVFDTSMLSYCLHDPSQVIAHTESEVTDDSTYVVKSVAILDQDMENTQKKRIKLVNVHLSETPG